MGVSPQTTQVDCTLLCGRVNPPEIRTRFDRAEPTWYHVPLHKPGMLLRQ